jgi:hypothetical protein
MKAQSYWILGGLALLAGCLLSCTAGCYPTHKDVQDFARIEQDFVRGLIDAHDKNMTEQHKHQTPAVAVELESLREQNAQLIAQIAGKARSEVEHHQSDLPFSDVGALVQQLIVSLGSVFGVLKLTPSRGSSDLASIKTALNAIKPGVIPG